MFPRFFVRSRRAACAEQSASIGGRSGSLTSDTKLLQAGLEGIEEEEILYRKQAGRVRACSPRESSKGVKGRMCAFVGEPAEGQGEPDETKYQ